MKQHSFPSRGLAYAGSVLEAKPGGRLQTRRPQTRYANLSTVTMAAFAAQCHVLAGVRPTRSVSRAGRRALTVKASGNGARVDKYSKSDIMCVLSPPLQCVGAGMAACCGARRRAWHLRLVSRAACRRPSSPQTLPSWASRCAVCPAQPGSPSGRGAPRAPCPGTLPARHRHSAGLDSDLTAG